ncbi:MAG: UvrD-helicase domain-containing protein [Planctomycetes bacterium]|jgi:superfamily I DNA/RNA helicase|nr:UvrD-helicase domain-containing protein [Planctomycetota bacterium]MBT6452381.1 UvrD-helicase domain-containing protein [Planctomycetota bacterium]MBT6541776.1 UvrD-helicase domain-containing protein [Planctomycetota bacterium]MBT6784485.1 UvrD-helicase domain-containing protein [Planctomycetota bacterium]MBT6968230.1 UvrD-helicase domain-containing protein [Planctomycetota bacterium]
MRLDLDVLNPEQREAVEHPGGPLLVLAGAGTGKTRVITYRIAHLMAHQGIQGDRILGITFTNKGAREMRQRLERMYPDLDPMPVLSTFHGFGLALIRQEHQLCGLRSRFPIYDDSDVRSVLTEIVRHLAGMSQAEARVDDVKGVISRWKSEFLPPERALEASADSFEELCARAFLRYRDRMKGLSAVDFDDLIQLPVQLLEQNEEARKRWSGRYDHLLIDEYQDTNSAQFRLARALVGEQENLCVVGDDDQSIYRFRGAEVEKILSFKKDFPAAHVVTLEKNYRSVGSILEAAHGVISRNPNRHPKKLISQRGPGSPIPLLICDGEMEEASEVVRSIHEARRSGLALSKQAILLRSAIQARPFEEKLRFYEIPYTIIGGMSFFDRREVRDVVAYLRCVVFPTDDIALLRILNTPRRGFGGVARERIDEQARSSGRGVQEVLKDPQVLEKISAISRKGARQLVDALDTARAQLAIDGRKALCQMLEDVKYDNQLKEIAGTDPMELESRRSIVDGLLDSIAHYESKHGPGNLQEWLRNITLDPRDDGGEEQGEVLTLMTFHGAKGLEFPLVHLVGVEEGLIPHRRALAEDGDAGEEEERRLMYVAMTRAMDHLIISMARQRRRYGKDLECEESRFLLDIPQEHLVRREIQEQERPVLEGSSARERLKQMRERLGEVDSDES